MFIEFERGLSDAKRWLRKSDLSLRNFGGKNVATSRPQPANPKTESQTAARDSMRAAAEAWRALPESGRAAWGAYAARHGERIADQLYKDLCGWDVFLPAWRNRSLLGQTPQEAPLDQAPPAAVAAVEELPTGSEGTFSFRLTHGAAPEGHRLLVRMTPATATRARRPYARQARLIAGHAPESLLDLPASGGVVTFTAPHMPVAPGQRFGLALRIVRVADGIHSREFFADLIRGGGGDASSPDEPPVTEEVPVTEEAPVVNEGAGDAGPILAVQSSGPKLTRGRSRSGACSRCGCVLRGKTYDAVTDPDHDGDAQIEASQKCYKEKQRRDLQCKWSMSAKEYNQCLSDSLYTYAICINEAQARVAPDEGARVPTVKEPGVLQDSPKRRPGGPVNREDSRKGVNSSRSGAGADEGRGSGV